MDDLSAYLSARYDEDEQTALAAGNRRWLVQDNIIELYPERENDGFMSWPTRADARHAANWEPARALREIDAKRQLLALHPRQEHPDPKWPKEWREREPETTYYCDCQCDGDRINGEWPCATMRLLALPYADRDGYREEWKP